MKTSVAIVIALALMLAGCHSKRQATGNVQFLERIILETRLQEQVQYFKERDPTIGHFLDDANGIIVFGYIYKAPAAGGLFGKGEAYERGRIAGDSTIFQRTGNFAIPGEYFREIIFFKNKPDFDMYKRCGGIIFSPQDIGIALDGGAAAKADYINGKAIFVMCDAGPMNNISCSQQIIDYARIPQ